MAKEVSYCESCGNRLFDRSFAYDGRTFCDACRPASRAPVAPARERRPSPKAPARRARESTRLRRKRGVLGPALGAAAAAALAAGIAVVASGPSPAPAPAPEPPARALVAAAPEPEVETGPSPEETLALVREIRESDRLFQRRDEVVKLLREAGGRGEADRLAAEYEKQFEDAAARLADFARSEALRLAAQKKFAQAIETVDGYPESFRSSRSAEALKTLRQDLERRRAESAGAERPPSRTPPGTTPILPLTRDQGI
jgi:hypothetical protein